MIKSIYKALGLDDKFMQPRAALSRISHAKSHAQSPEEIARAATDPTTTRFATVYERYEARLRESNALDFDDLLLEAVNLLRHDDATRQRLNQRYEFVMVDEYQDTNRSQYDLMRLLTEQRHNICVVGDEDQSIYGWRGANIRNILDFERDFPGATIIRLEQNYRSTQTILEAASAVVAHNTERIGKTLWTDSGAGEKITLYEAPDSENEALWIADTVEPPGPQSPRASSRPLPHQFAIPPDRRSPAPLRPQIHRSRRLQLLSTRRSEGHPRVSESLGQSARFDRTAPRHQHPRARHRPHHSRTDRAVRAATRTLPVDLAGANARSPRLPGRAEAALAAFHRMMTELASQLDSRPIGETLADVLERTGYRKMLEDEGTEGIAPAPGEPRRIAQRRGRCRRARRNSARFPGPRRPGLRRRFQRLPRPRVTPHHAQRRKASSSP